MHLRVHDLLEQLGYMFEWFAPGYVAVNLEPNRQHHALEAGLAALSESVEIERILVDAT